MKYAIAHDDRDMVVYETQGEPGGSTVESPDGIDLYNTKVEAQSVIDKNDWCRCYVAEAYWLENDPVKLHYALDFEQGNDFVFIGTDAELKRDFGEQLAGVDYESKAPGDDEHPEATNVACERAIGRGWYTSEDLAPWRGESPQ